MYSLVLLWRVQSNDLFACFGTLSREHHSATSALRMIVLACAEHLEFVPQPVCILYLNILILKFWWFLLDIEDFYILF